MQAKSFFSEEKNEKTFNSPPRHVRANNTQGMARDRSANAEIKVFCCFSSEKKTLASTS
jgi:hypothetical protein